MALEDGGQIGKSAQERDCANFYQFTNFSFERIKVLILYFYYGWGLLGKFDELKLCHPEEKLPMTRSRSRI